MKNTFQIIIFSTIATVSLIHIPDAEAASLQITTSNEIRAQDVFIVDVQLDTEGQNINTIEGTIQIQDSTKNFEIRDVSVAGSRFTIWPRKPSLSIGGDTISFVGGSPEGIDGKVSVFKMIVFAKNSSELRVSPINIVGYLNDGKGTAVEVKVQDKIISVSPSNGVATDEWRKIVSSDNTAPEIFEIFLFQDPSLYDGKKFLSFPTTDTESGIAYYEVQEGGALPVKTGDQYVLVNQDSIEDISVTAYDFAGNARAGVFTDPDAINWKAIFVWTLILCVVFIFTKIRRVRNLFKKNAKR